VAYDLNKGIIKWKVPFGQDAKAAEEGATDTGAFMAEHHGMIVTATGLIFIAASDGRLRAYDEETGKTLWSVTLPSSSEGIPAMYEVSGRQYLVISASSNPNTAGRGRTAGSGPDQIKGYIAFALPEKSGR
jgi:quinoprotein glucose dehydrogenase